MRIIQDFPLSKISTDLNRFLVTESILVEKALNAIGLKFVSEARLNTKIEKLPPLTYPHDSKGFYDISANLRSSIGYIVQKDTKEISSNFEGKSEGKNKGLATAKKIASKFTGYSLILVAGMDYAVAVESKGYDVISSSIPLRSQILKLLKLYTGLK